MNRPSRWMISTLSPVTILISLSTATASAQADGYTLDWFSIDNDVGLAIGGAYTLKGGTTAFIGMPTRTILREDDIIWGVDLLADDVNDALVIKGFSNTSGDTIRFVATVRTVEVSY